MRGDIVPDPQFVAARRVLLDALDALGPHRESVILVGAQAIYLHIGEGDLAVSPFTTDGDLTIDPRNLGDAPELSTVLESAGFQLTVRPGTWTLADVPVDLLVPTSLGGPGRRGARLGVHGNHVARKASGLEAAVVDHAPIRIPALDPTDPRELDVNVAGIAALLVAKLHKIYERKDNFSRQQDKDGLDVLRLLRFADTSVLAARLMSLSTDPVAGEVSLAARDFLKALFSSTEAPGVRMAVRASVGLDDSTHIAASCEVLSNRLLAAWK